MKGPVCGIDPGMSGAVAFFWPDTGGLDVFDVPTMAAGGKTSKRVLDHVALAGLFDREDVVHAWIEEVHAMPGQGVTSMFNFGSTFGALRQAVASAFIPVSFVTPASWKKALRVPAAKDGARARASELMPRHAGKWTRVKDDGRAEAAMIALYGARLLAGA